MVPPTRRTVSETAKNPSRLSMDKQQQQQQLQTQHTQQLLQVLSGTDDTEPDEQELNQLLGSLTEESQSLVKILTLVLTKKVKTEINVLKNELNKKDDQINKLNKEINDLKDKVQDLETNIDSVDQYERRDTIIVSGPLIPEESHQENAANIIITAIRDHLKINLKESDINIAHRIGSAHTQHKRPIIVKLGNRSLKHDLVGACIQMKPQLYINESLTPKRLHLFKQILNIRKTHKDKFQQCHTKEGKIIIKLKNSTVRHEIVDERTLLTFLDKYPLMKDTYFEAASST